MVDVVLAGNIGGTGTQLELQDMQGTTLDSAKFRTPQRYQDALEQVAVRNNSMFWGIDNFRIVATGIDVAGAVNSEGDVTGAGNLHDFIGKSLKRDLELTLGVPAVVMNDCAAEALGEFTVYGEELVYVGAGTGVGVGAVYIVDGKPFVKCTECGHITIAWDSSVQCGCGGYGHLESFVGGAMLIENYGDNWWENVSNQQLFKIYEQMAAGLSTISVFEPERFEAGMPIIMGGSTILNRPGSFHVLQAILAKRITTVKTPQIRMSTLNGRSGLVGMGYAARQLIAV